MARYRRKVSRVRKGNSTSSAAKAHVGEYHRLRRSLGPVVEDVKRLFLDFDQEKIDLLLKDYKSLYGNSAASYARQTIPHWKSGKTKLSGQTMERLLELVPRYIETKERYELVKKAAEHYQFNNKKFEKVVIDLKNPNEGLDQLEVALERLGESSVLKEVPPELWNRVTWLSDNDVVVARGILADIDNKMSERVKNSARNVRNTIKSMINEGNTEFYQETFEFPNGKLTVTASKPSACFVANVCLKEDDILAFSALRSFRDEMVNEGGVGRRFVIEYYKFSPWVSSKIGNSVVLMASSRYVILMAARLLRRMGYV